MSLPLSDSVHRASQPASQAGRQETRTHTHTDIQDIHICISYTHTYIPASMLECIHTYMHMCMHRHKHVHMHILDHMLCICLSILAWLGVHQCTIEKREARVGIACRQLPHV